jgi:outer membrane protein assembly factor BamB
MPSVRPNLQIYFKFDENTGTAACDRSGNSRHGTLSGTTLPVINGGSVLLAVGDPDARVLRLDPATGTTVWQAGEGIFQQALAAAPAVADDHVVVAEIGGRYHSFALADGAWQWTSVAPGAAQASSPLIVGDRVYMLPAGTPNESCPRNANGHERRVTTVCNAR